MTWWLLSALQDLATAASDTSGLSGDLAGPLFPLLDGAAIDSQTFLLVDHQEKSRISFHTPTHTRSIPQPCVCHRQPMFDMSILHRSLV